VRRKAAKPSRPDSGQHDDSRSRRVAMIGGQQNVNALPRGKTRLTMYLDMAVVEYFRSRAGGRGYQTLINEALRRAIEQEHLEEVLRRVIREESRVAPAGKART
jgi:uncharacterized protein (DUF4415 family)